MWVIIAYACAVGHVPMDITDTKCAVADKWVKQFTTSSECEHFRGEYERMEIDLVLRELVRPGFRGVIEVRCEGSS